MRIVKVEHIYNNALLTMHLQYIRNRIIWESLEEEFLLLLFSVLNLGGGLKQNDPDSTSLIE